MSSSLIDAATLDSMDFVATETNFTGGALPRYKRKQMERERKVSNGPLTPTKINNIRTSRNAQVGLSGSNLSTSNDCVGSRIKRKASDRFIPNRANMDMEVSSFMALDKLENSADGSNSKDLHKQLGKGMGMSSKQQSRILSFAEKAPAPKAGYHDAINMMWTKNPSSAPAKKRKCTRKISDAPERVLDAPDLLDDYYLNLVDWSSNSMLAVALNQTVFLWNAATGDIQELSNIEEENHYVSSVSWIRQGGNVIAVGTSKGTVELWDVKQQRRLRTMGGGLNGGRRERVGVLAWNDHILTSGSRDANLIDHDVRVQNHMVNSYCGHQQEVCGLAWNDDKHTLASGANDNMCAIWDNRRSQQQQDQSGMNQTSPTFTLREHVAAVKALAWCPHQRNLLATGGGTADKCIKLWNTTHGKMTNSVNTGSQVCSLLWSPYEKELLSGHGFSEYQLALWKVSGTGRKLSKIKELKGSQGHQGRVLSLCSGENGMVCSAGADETLRFWNIFGGRSRVEKKKLSSTTRGILSTANVSKRDSSRMMLR